MKYSLVKGYCSAYGVKRMCRLFKISRSGYYAWRVRGKSRRKLANERLLIQIKKAYAKGLKVYGSPRVTDALNESGHTCGRNRVARLMRTKVIIAKTKRRFKATTNSDHKLPISPNSLKRNFTVSAPNTVWVADITYVWTKEGWLYLAAVMDLFNRGIVVWPMGSRINSELTVNALRQAVQRRRPGKIDGIVNRRKECFFTVS